MGKENPLKALLKKANLTAENSVESLEYQITKYFYDESIIRAKLVDFIEKIDRGTTKKERDDFILEMFRMSYMQMPRKGGVFSPSQFATENPPCVRKMYFQYAHTPADDSFISDADESNQLQRIFDIGTFLHLYIQSNLDYHKMLTELEPDVEIPDFGVYGHGDGKVWYQMQEMLLEIKSINSFGFDKLKEPKPEHKKQASVYAVGLGLKKILFIYYDKNTSKLKSFVTDVDTNFVADFGSLAKTVMTSYRSNVRQTRSTDIEKHTLPTRFLCKSRSGERALSCPYAEKCFKLK